VQALQQRHKIGGGGGGGGGGGCGGEQFVGITNVSVHIREEDTERNNEIEHGSTA
ncbi:hypothetical protein LINPERHAP1_LOCUS21946, partial [Linum perenne]